MTKRPSDPFDAARRELAPQKEQMLRRALREAQPDTVMGTISFLLEHGIVDFPQAEVLAFSDPRRAVFELKMIGNIARDEGISLVGNSERFEEIQAAGSKYFFENYSPLAGLIVRENAQ